MTATTILTGAADSTPEPDRTPAAPSKSAVRWPQRKPAPGPKPGRELALATLRRVRAIQTLEREHAEKIERLHSGKDPGDRPSQPQETASVRRDEMGRAHEFEHAGVTYTVERDHMGRIARLHLRR